MKKLYVYADFDWLDTPELQINSEKLFDNMVYHIIVGNSDNHFRNHGLILTHNGGELSPAYDINLRLSEFELVRAN